jgi:ABC-2 type transport system ATP-binding protein
MTQVIEVRNLHKAYDGVAAVDHVSFSVEEGEIFGIIGPNGAGKTTTIESVIGLRKPDGGSVSVLGLDPLTEARKLGNRIGTQLQEAALPERMKVWEALDLYASFYEKTVPWQPLVEQWGLAEKRDTQFGALSGGQKQRLFIALALLNDPQVVFPRRADDRARPAGSPGDLGPGPRHPRAGQDRCLNHSFYGRG